MWVKKLHQLRWNWNELVAYVFRPGISSGRSSSYPALRYLQSLWQTLLVPCSHTEGLLTESTHGSLFKGFLEPQEHTSLAQRWVQAGILGMRKALRMNSQPTSDRNWWIKEAAPLPLSGTAQSMFSTPSQRILKGLSPVAHRGCLLIYHPYLLPSIRVLSLFPIPHSVQQCLGLSTKESFCLMVCFLGNVI